jgi:hypothetical protein
MATDGAVRVSDAERGRVADRLARAHGEGRLTLAEYDERVRAAHGAVVRDDLAPLLGDLPADDAARPVASAPVDAPGHHGRRLPVPPGFPVPPGLSGLPGLPGLPVPPGGLRGAVAAWAVVSVLNVAIWLAVVLGTGSLVYPWWIWVAGPWGMVLLLGALGRGPADRGRGTRPERTALSRT